MMEFVRFVSQDSDHFLGALLVLYFVFNGLVQIAKAVRGG